MFFEVKLKKLGMNSLSCSMYNKMYNQIFIETNKSFDRLSEDSEIV